MILFPFRGAMMFCQSISSARLSVFILFLAVWGQGASAAEWQDSNTHDSTGETKALWYGELDVESRLFRFLVTTIADSDGKLSSVGELKSLDEGNQSFKIQDVFSTAESFRFELKATKASYSGSVSLDGKQTDGKWKQAGLEFDLNFRSVIALPPEKLNNYWTGTLDAGFQKLRVAIRERADGKVLFDSLTQQSGGFVASKTVDGGDVIIEVPAIKGTFTGKLSSDGSEMVGKWKQGLFPLSLTLKKTEVPKEPEQAIKRPQTPQPPFTYRVEEVLVTNPEEPGVTLSGTLTLPGSKKPRATVILISGSGPQDRDETIFDHKPFLVIADYLTQAGFAVLRCDDRGVGKSTGDFDSATTVEFASDIRAMVAFLRQYPSIDPDRIVLCGHSEGGLIAPMVAAGDSNIGGLILLAAPGVNGEQVLVSQAELILKASGVAADDIAKQLQQQRMMIDLALRNPPLERAEFESEAKRLLGTQLPDNTLSTEEFDQLITQSSAQLTSPWFRYFLTYEPSVALKKIRCPTLVLNGELDLQVEAELNVKAIESVFQETGFMTYEVQVLPRLNHVFQTAETGSPTEYSGIEETFSPIALKAMGEWLTKTFEDYR